MYNEDISQAGVICLPFLFCCTIVEKAHKKEDRELYDLEVF